LRKIDGIENDSEFLTADQLERGYQLATLLIDPASWIHRRVEYLSLLSDATVERRVSLDVDPSRTGFPRTPILPLALLDKRLLVGFSLRGEALESLPLATREENGLLSLAVLAALAETAVGQPPSNALLWDLGQLVVEPDSAAAVRLLMALRRSQALQPLFADRDFATFAGIFATRFLLLTPHSGDPSRRIIKFAYVERLGSWEGMSSPAARIAGSLAWSPLRFVFLVRGFGEGVSHHLEAVSPSGLDVAHVDCSIPTRAGFRPIRVRRVETRSHVHVPSGLDFRDLGFLYVDLRPPRDDFLWGAVIATLLVTVMTAVVALNPLSEGAQREGISVLLVVPGLVALAVARPQEHALRARMLRGLRAIVAVSALLIFGYAFQLAIDLPSICLSPLKIEGWMGCRLRPTWWWGFAVACALFVSTLPALLFASDGEDD
jgi:hypothetical protein